MVKTEDLPDQFQPNPFIDDHNIDAWEEGFIKGRKYERTVAETSKHAYQQGVSEGESRMRREIKRRLDDQRRELLKEASRGFKKLEEKIALLKGMLQDKNLTRRFQVRRKRDAENGSERIQGHPKKRISIRRNQHRGQHGGSIQPVQLPHPLDMGGDGRYWPDESGSSVPPPWDRDEPTDA